MSTQRTRSRHLNLTSRCRISRNSLERFLNFINKNAYIQTAIMGNSFCKAAADACLLLIRNCLRVGTLQIVSTVFIFLGKYFIALVVGDEFEKSLTLTCPTASEKAGTARNECFERQFSQA